MSADRGFHIWHLSNGVDIQIITNSVVLLELKVQWDDSVMEGALQQARAASKEGSQMVQAQQADGFGVGAFLPAPHSPPPLQREVLLYVVAKGEVTQLGSGWPAQVKVPPLPQGSSGPLGLRFSWPYTVGGPSQVPAGVVQDLGDWILQVRPCAAAMLAAVAAV